MNEVKKTDIKDTKEALKLGFALIGAIKVSQESGGKIDIADIGNLMMVFPHFGAAIEGIETVPAEIRDLDSDEAKELMVFASTELGGALSDEQIVVKIEKSLKAVLAIFEAVKAFR